MGIETGTAILLSSILGAGTAAVSSQKAGKRAKRARGEVEKATTKLEEEQDVSRSQAAQKILKGRGAQGKNVARSTILTQGLELGGTATGKTLLGE